MIQASPARPIESQRSSSCWRAVHGILLFDKPRGPSSNRALQQVRRIYRAEKAGHTGSLDPLASGLLPICFGEATKIAGLLLGSDKAYEAECRLGVTTSTDDAEGEVVTERAVPRLSPSTVESELAALTGLINQVPPVYSAIKRDGVPLYRRARRGEHVTASPRQIEVKRLDLVHMTPAGLRLHIECGSGTYVRSLVRDLGERLGCGAHVSALRRLWIEPFRNPAMTDIEALETLAKSGDAAIDALLVPIELGLAGYPTVRLDAEAAVRLSHGQTVGIEVAHTQGRCVALDEHGRALALCVCDGQGFLTPVRGFNLPR